MMSVLCILSSSVWSVTNHFWHSSYIYLTYMCHGCGKAVWITEILLELNGEFSVTDLLVVNVEN